jgi:hypothetical protein
MTSRICRGCGPRDRADHNRSGSDSGKENALHGFVLRKKVRGKKTRKI